MMFPITITKDEVMDRPLRSYDGKVVIAADAESIDKAVSEINQSRVVGFDTEAKPTFKKGEIRNISLIQVATEDKVYLLRTQYVGISNALHRFLENPDIIKVGIGLLDDYNLLDRLRPFTPDGYIDLNDTFNELGAEKIGARNLAAMVLDIRISKSAQTSNWEAQTLTDKQVRYASTDAWICLEIYNKLLDWGYI